jgi:hypothetical protein
MVNMTLSVPSDLRSRMDSFSEINWSAVAREAFDEKVHDLELVRKFKAKSTMTENDALKLGRELSKQLDKKRKQ